MLSRLQEHEVHFPQQMAPAKWGAFQELMLEELEGQRVKRAVLRRSNVKRASSPVAIDFQPPKGRARTPVSELRDR
jgi:hypothetical protein